MGMKRQRGVENPGEDEASGSSGQDFRVFCTEFHGGYSQAFREAALVQKRTHGFIGGRRRGAEDKRVKAEAKKCGSGGRLATGSREVAFVASGLECVVHAELQGL